MTEVGIVIEARRYGDVVERITFAIWTDFALIGIDFISSGTLISDEVKSNEIDSIFSPKFTVALEKIVWVFSGNFTVRLSVTDSFSEVLTRFYWNSTLTLNAFDDLGDSNYIRIGFDSPKLLLSWFDRIELILAIYVSSSVVYVSAKSMSCACKTAAVSPASSASYLYPRRIPVLIACICDAASVGRTASAIGLNSA